MTEATAMFGSLSSSATDAGAISGAEFILNLAMRMTDPERRAFREEAERWLEASRKYEAARREHDQTAKLLSDREARVTVREQQVAQAESRAEELGLAAADKMAKAEQRWAEFESLRAELKQMAA
jgi:hypothetical protein